MAEEASVSPPKWTFYFFLGAAALLIVGGLLGLASFLRKDPVGYRASLKVLLVGFALYVASAPRTVIALQRRNSKDLMLLILVGYFILVAVAGLLAG